MTVTVSCNPASPHAQPPQRSHQAGTARPWLSTRQPLWRWLAYHHQAAETLLYLLFLSGLALWSVLALPWPLQSVNLCLHMALSITLYPLLVVSFWLAHRTLLARSRKPWLIVTGRLIEGLLLVCTISGLVLLLHGAPGDALGTLARDLHLYSGLALAPLVMRHAFRWSVLNRLFTRVIRCVR